MSTQARWSGFNPLHCGAVVASCTTTDASDSNKKFQSPSLRGSGRFPITERCSQRCSPCFNPLHCGAVVASLYATTANAQTVCFNPLHCGAVVASTATHALHRTHLRVSIPFIAGQWSLPPAAWRRGREDNQFQSPSLRGSGRFAEGQGGQP